MGELKTQAFIESHFFILCGDFNAEVGNCLPDDDNRIVGVHALGNCNDLGAWLKQ